MPTSEQANAFLSNAGFTLEACELVLVSSLFAVLLLWGVWAMRTAYVGWAESSLSHRQFFGVLFRFLAIYLVLGFLLLS